MYAILKPESRMYMGKVESLLEEEGFRVSSIHGIDDWEDFARSLYYPQISSDRGFREEFNAYLWLTNNLHGNNAVAILLDSKGRDKLESLIRLGEIKTKFREEVINGKDDPLRILLNLEKINGSRDIGIRGTVNVSGYEFPSVEMGGRWDYFFFKYIHSPDPVIESYEREMDLLRDRGVLNNLVSKEKWDCMKYLQTMRIPKDERE